MNPRTLSRVLREPASLAATDVDRFDRRGFIKLEGVLSPDLLQAFEPYVSRAVRRLGTERRPLAERDTYGRAFLQVTNLWRHCARVRELVFSPRLAGLAARLMNVRRVRLYHDQALFKEPGGGTTPWHVDQFYWPLATDRTCTVWIPLQDTPAEMGPLTFAVGSHRVDVGRDVGIGDDSERRIAVSLERQRLAVREEPCRLGDVTWHSGWTAHRSGANRTARLRRALTVIYMDAEARVAEPRNAFQQADLDAWLAGVRPGEVADSPLTPVLFPAAGSQGCRPSGGQQAESSAGRLRPVPR